MANLGGHDLPALTAAFEAARRSGRPALSPIFTAISASTQARWFVPRVDIGLPWRNKAAAEACNT
jgi:hypothetical protein